MYRNLSFFSVSVFFLTFTILNLILISVLFSIIILIIPQDLTKQFGITSKIILFNTFIPFCNETILSKQQF